MGAAHTCPPATVVAETEQGQLQVWPEEKPKAAGNSFPPPSVTSSLYCAGGGGVGWEWGWGWG